MALNCKKFGSNFVKLLGKLEGNFIHIGRKIRSNFKKTKKSYGKIWGSFLRNYVDLDIEDFLEIFWNEITTILATIDFRKGWAGKGGNSRPNRTTDIGEDVPPRPVFRLSFSRYEFLWGKNLQTVFDTPFSTKKVIFIFVVKWACETVFALSSKYTAFSEKIL